jgi:hypothetical protein
MTWLVKAVKGMLPVLQSKPWPADQGYRHQLLSIEPANISKK